MHGFGYLKGLNRNHYFPPLRYSAWDETIPCVTMRVYVLLLLQVGVLLMAGCVAVARLDHVPTTTPTPPDRTTCGEILGTAFRSDSEQAWFVQNCSAWNETTLGTVTAPPAAGSPTPAPGSPGPQTSPQAQGREEDTQRPSGTPTPTPTPTQQRQLQGEDRCAAQRGRPYQSDEDREWYRQNCLGGTPTALAESRDCDQIRGRPYASEAQRRWFLANCGGSQASGQDGGSQGGNRQSGGGSSQDGSSTQGGVGPEGRPCSAIYGTRYVSRAEREWFQANCPQ